MRMLFANGTYAIRFANVSHSLGRINLSKNSYNACRICWALGSLLAILFLIDGRIQWWVYTVIFVTAIVLLVATFLTLVVYFFRIHVQTKNQIPWELVFNTLACVISLVFAGFLFYDVIRMYNGEFDHHRYSPPPNIGTSGWRSRMLVVTIAEVFNALAYGFSMIRTRQYGIV